MQPRSSAWTLAAIYAALIVFASLFPFEGWRVQGVDPWVFLTAKLPPPYWTWFDVNTNIAGYVPLGFLLALGMLRDGRRARWAVPLAALLGAALSLGMEFLQIYLPRRVPSNLDLSLNAAGALLGALLAALLERLGALQRWAQFRERWLAPGSGGAVALLALWPASLLFPTALPFGLGQVLERLDLWLDEQLEDTPFMSWLPLWDAPMTPLTPGAELLCVMLGLLIPCLLGYCVITHKLRRAVFAVCIVLAGVGVTALSAALTYGPVHAWEWLQAPGRAAIWGGVLVALALVPVPRRICGVLLLVALSMHLSWLNQASTDVYFAQTLQVWEQGRFIRFYGLAQWLGWLWPYATLIYVGWYMAQRAAAPRMAA
ncbi:VanZ family protein [Comamonas sp. CMM03]|uniref:VanZ family protein n=1 Tax=Comamonas sp. CMM03 TaxID=2854781 RepID=UPI001C47ABAB|nr:VanZ family protein [Comamonas sp. CMM03]MBV7419338.1 VanZ family protein [Comamonas sp. CMM03]